MLVPVALTTIAVLLVVFTALTYRLRWQKAETRARRYRSQNNDMIDYISQPSNIWWP